MPLFEQTKANVGWSILTICSVVASSFGQVSFSSISQFAEPRTALIVAFGDKVQVSDDSLATDASIRTLANADDICILPYNALWAKEVISDLPTTRRIAEDLQSDKQLRQLRNQLADLLAKQGLHPVDCVADKAAQKDAYLLVTNISRWDGLPAFHWILYANSQINVHGELELLALARPAYNWIPLSPESMVEQIQEIRESVQAAISGHLAKKLSDIKSFCIKTVDADVSQSVGNWLSGKGYAVSKSDCDARVHVYGDAVRGWNVSILPVGGGGKSLLDVHEQSLQGAVKKLDKALRKAQ